MFTVDVFVIYHFSQNGRFPSKIAFRLKKVCYKISLCENCQRPS